VIEIEFNTMMSNEESKLNASFTDNQMDSIRHLMSTLKVKQPSLMLGWNLKNRAIQTGSISWRQTNYFDKSLNSFKLLECIRLSAIIALSAFSAYNRGTHLDVVSAST
jgi:hypothetical protein